MGFLLTLFGHHLVLLRLLKNVFGNILLSNGSLTNVLPIAGYPKRTSLFKIGLLVVWVWAQNWNSGECFRAERAPELKGDFDYGGNLVLIEKKYCLWNFQFGIAK